MSKIEEIFNNQKLNEPLLNEIIATVDAKVKFIIAITPRSGSSLLCDVLKNTHAFGRPDELLSDEFLPEILIKIPGRNPDEYLQNVLKRLKSKNGISGLKASWFQFETFFSAMQNGSVLQQFKYIYLVRRDLFAQAVSLYKATRSSVFHTNVSHGSEALDRLATLEYDFETINEWYRHICKQEAGWQSFFDKHHIFPLFITYEDIEKDVVAVVKRIAAYFGMAEKEVENCSSGSVFRKIGDRTNVEWACRFELELDELKRRTKQKLSDVRDRG